MKDKKLRQALRKEHLIYLKTNGETLDIPQRKVPLLEHNVVQVIHRLEVLMDHLGLEFQEPERVGLQVRKKVDQT